MKLACDFAWTEARGDFTALAIYGLDADRHLWITEVITFQKAQNGIVDEIWKLHDRCHFNEIVCDQDTQTKNFRDYFWAVSKMEGRPLLPFEFLKVGRQKNDKVNRAATLRGMIQSGHLHFVDGPWVSEARSQLMQFPNSRYDDIVDALSLAARHMQRRAGYTEPGKSDSDPYAHYLYPFVENEVTGRQEPILNASGQMQSRMTLDQLFEDAKYPRRLPIASRRF